MCVCVFVCLFCIEIQTARPISMKFGMGVVLEGEKVLSWVLTPYPNPRGQGGPKIGPPDPGIRGDHFLGPFLCTDIR